VVKCNTLTATIATLIIDSISSDNSKRCLKRQVNYRPYNKEWKGMLATYGRYVLLTIENILATNGVSNTSIFYVDNDDTKYPIRLKETARIDMTCIYLYWKYRSLKAFYLFNNISFDISQEVVSKQTLYKYHIPLKVIEWTII